MGLELPVPDYSTMGRRQAGLEVNLRLRTYAGTRHIVADSTGLKVYDASEWHAGEYQRARRRAWRKLHLGVNETTKEILAADITESRVHDSRRLQTLLSRMPDNIAQVSGDWGYPCACNEAVLACGAVATIVPRRKRERAEERTHRLGV